MLDFDELNQYTGTENWHKFNWLFQYVVMTDGAKYVADSAGAYWMMELIASYQRKLHGQDFQVWKLEVTGSKAQAICEDGNDNILINQDIDYTNFPEPGIKLYAVYDGQYTIIMLPGEY